MVKRYSISFFGIAIPLSWVFVSFLLPVTAVFADSPDQTQDADSRARFTQNKGQWPSHINYTLDFRNGRLFMENNRLTYLFHSWQDLERVYHGHHNHPNQQQQHNHHQHQHDQKKPDNSEFNSHAFRVNFAGASPKPATNGHSAFADYENFFRGNDPSRWATHVRSFQEVTYQDLYPGIDMHFEGKGENLKYTFTVEPGAKPAKIGMVYKGLEDIRLDDKRLKMTTTVNQITEKRPYAYQMIDGEKVEVPCYFKLDSNRVSFVFPSGYNSSVPLVIDPVLIFSTYTGSTADNWGYTATFDTLGHGYSGGVAFNPGYPTTTGAFQTSFAGGNPGPFNYLSGTDAAITKYNASGTNRLYSTYLGGKKNDQPQSMFVNSQNELLVFGSTESPDFPVTPNAYDTTYGGGDSVIVSNVLQYKGADIFISKFSVDGSSLLASTYLGGSGIDGLNAGDTTVGNNLRFNYADHARGEIIADQSDAIYIASSTRSLNYPVTTGAAQVLPGGNQDGCITKLSSDLSSIIWSSFIGGSEDDAAYSVKLDSRDRPIVAGGTKSTNFPGLTGVNTSYHGGVADGFVLKMDSSGNTIMGGSYLGTSSYDQAYFIDLDIFDNVFVYGQTLGNYPVGPSGVYVNPNSTQFLHKLSPDLTSTQFSTVIGGGADSTLSISPTAFLVDVCENIYMSGWGGQVNIGSGAGSDGQGGKLGTTTNMPVTSNAFQQTTDGSDFHVTVLGPDGQSLEFASYFGGVGPNGEHVDGGTSRFNEEGVIYQAVCAGCGGTNIFPTTPGVVSQTNNSSNCNLALLKYDIELKGVSVDVRAVPEDTGCVPHTVTFLDQGVNSRDLHWDFGDGTTSTDSVPTHTFSDTGTYTVQLIGVDSFSCAGITFRDTSTTTITVVDDSLEANFTDSIISDCGNYVVDFVNTSPQDSSTQFFWNFGDGDTSSAMNPTHQYDSSGTYFPRLFAINNQRTCNEQVFAVDTVQFKPTLNADFSTNDTAGCLPFTAQFQNSSTATANSSYFWSFGDGDTSSQPSPVHSYDSTGTFPVSLILTDSSACNISDSAKITVQVVEDSLVADFTVNELSRTCDSVTVQFQNQSANATSFTWQFGNGDTSNATSPIYSYQQPGTFDVTLVANAPPVCANQDTATSSVTLLPEVQAQTSLTDTSGCPPFSITMDGSTANGDSTYWLLNDTLFSQAITVTKTIADTGIFTASLISLDTDSMTCNIADTASFTIDVNNDSVEADFNLIAPRTCDSLPVALNNLSQGATSYLWKTDNGDTSQQFEPNFTFSQTGQHWIQLIASNASACSPTDTIQQTTELLPRVVAQKQMEDTTGCLPLSLTLQGNSVNADSVFWMVDDSVISFNSSTPYTFRDSGTFTASFVTLDVDSSTCNLQDTASFTVTVNNDSVRAAFTLTDPNSCDSLPITLTNNSQNASSYNWNFGDGATSNNFEPTHTYTAPDTYQITLVVSNPNRCFSQDTATKPVELLPRVSAPAIPDRVVCPPFTVSFDTMGQNAESYFWQFGDGTTDTSIAPVHTYSDTGTFFGNLVVSNPRSCNLADTVPFKVIASRDTVVASFDANYMPQCDSLPVSLINQSQNATNYRWSFGNGDTSILFEPRQTYTQPGEYWITLRARQDSVCVPIDTARKKVKLKPRVTADFIPPQKGCAPFTTTFENTSQQARTFQWDFDDGTTSQQRSPTHEFASTGEFTVTLVTRNDSTCNITDTARTTVNVFASPLARFETDTSVQRIFNEVEFDNQSQGGDTFEWTFGDGTGSNAFEPTHKYDQEGTYKVCLETSTNNGCIDTTCDTVRMIFEARVDVPNAFSPNGDGVNDVLFVEGFGVKDIEFRIYNRWGEKVFESNDMDNGWDGKYKGRKQEMEVYVYVLEATFLNGKETKQKGNITLLR